MATPYKTANPALSFKASPGLSDVMGETMTIEGTVNKTGILLLCTMATAALDWYVALNPKTAGIEWPLEIAGMAGGFIFAVVSIFKNSWSPVTAPLYAILEGLALGGISVHIDQHQPGIAVAAVCLTFGVLFVMLLAWRFHIIEATKQFRLWVTSATSAVFLFYLVDLLLTLAHVHFLPIRGGGIGILGLVISLIIVFVAAFNLIIDFDQVTRDVAAGAPKYMEWYDAFGLILTLVWIYLEILRLLARIGEILEFLGFK